MFATNVYWGLTVCWSLRSTEAKNAEIHLVCLLPESEHQGYGGIDYQWHQRWHHHTFRSHEKVFSSGRILRSSIKVGSNYKKNATGGFFVSTVIRFLNGTLRNIGFFCVLEIEKHFWFETVWQCDMMRTRLPFVSGCWHRGSQPSEVPKWWGYDEGVWRFRMSLFPPTWVYGEGQLLNSCGGVTRQLQDGTGHQKDHAMIRDLRLSRPAPDLGEGSLVITGQWLNQSYL
jgi:hypothetical protein